MTNVCIRYLCYKDTFKSLFPVLPDVYFYSVPFLFPREMTYFCKNIAMTDVLWDKKGSFYNQKDWRM